MSAASFVIFSSGNQNLNLIDESKQKATEIVQDLTKHVREETSELTKMQAEVKSKDEQILRWERAIMKKLEDLNADIKQLEKDLTKNNIGEGEKKQEKEH